MLSFINSSADNDLNTDAADTTATMLTYTCATQQCDRCLRECSDLAKVKLNIRDLFMTLLAVGGL